MRLTHMVGVLIVYLLASTAAAQVPVREVSLTNTEYREFTSKITNRQYAVFVALPDGYKADQTKRYPVLYSTDAHIGFPLITYIYRLMRLTNDVPEMIIVGLVGKDPEAWMTLRGLELTPTRNISRDAELAKTSGKEVRSGDGAGFLRVFTDELIPEVERRYRTNGDRVYAGHSFGGLFGAYALLQDSNPFGRMILVSPTLSWDATVMLKSAEKFTAAERRLRAHVFVAVGSLELSSMISNSKRFTSILTQHQQDGLVVHGEVFENETHTSVFPGAFARGLRTVFPNVSSK